MTNQNNTNNNPYGHLLDKYLDSDHVDFETKQQRKEEAKNRYGHLLDYAKPDYSALEHISKIEDGFIKQRKQREEEKRLAALKRQERLENERRKEEDHIAHVREYGESFIKNKQERIKAAQQAEEQARKEAEKQQEIYNTIDSLMKISPESANAYIQALKEGNVI